MGFLDLDLDPGRADYYWGLWVLGFGGIHGLAGDFLEGGRDYYTWGKWWWLRRREVGDELLFVTVKETRNGV
ncbi:hypothetical protein ACH5RR_028645 [Cinchona calisaya]|uniref:Uncharacterized protein n=1 Tax=Cinchona calisaya TaxID=153742 RepID=A0ABD2YT16_9GENT